MNAPIHPVGSLMSPDPTTVPTTGNVHDAVTILRQRRLRHLPVVDDDGALVGLVSEIELFAATRSGDAYRELGSLALPCTRPPTADTDVVEALAWQLYDKRDATVVVDEDRRPVGIFTDHDALGFAAERLEAGLTVADLMHSGTPHGIGPTATLVAARKLMEAMEVHHLLVIEEGEQALGIVSWRDVVGREAGEVRQLLGKALKDTTTDTHIGTAIGLMQSRRIGSLPVWNPAGVVVGILTRTDIVKRLVRQLLAEDMEDGPPRP